MPTTVLRTKILHLLDDPRNAIHPLPATVAYFPDGILWVENGYIRAVGHAAELLPQLPPDCRIDTYPNHLLIPGLIDTHTHYPQTDMLAAYGTQLLQWLETYTFPTERQFADPQHARAVAEFFLDELLRNGTTTACVLGTVHPASVEAFFTAAAARNLRMIAGKVLMDRHCPADLQDTPASAYHDSKTLIEKWHGRARLAYAVTPRFAPTSSPAQLRVAGQLLQEHPDVYLQTHLAENRAEVAWVQALFPERRSYLEVYQHDGLLRKRSIFAHCLHLDDTDRQCLARSGAAIAFCPTANLFLGSGLFNVQAAKAHAIPVGLGTDIGAGTSFSLLQTANAAYKVAQLQGTSLTPLQLLYWLTLGAARALDLDTKIGNFAVGKEADFILLNPQATPLLARRSAHCRDVTELLFVLLMLGDERVVSKVWIMGAAVPN